MSPVWLPRRSFSGKRCPKCSYDLSGSRTGRCPECGTLYTTRYKSLRSALKQRWNSASRLSALVYLGALAVAAVLPLHVSWEVLMFPASLVASPQGMLGRVVLALINVALWGGFLGACYVAVLLVATQLPAIIPRWPDRFRRQHCRECGVDLTSARGAQCPQCNAAFPRFSGRQPSNLEASLTSHWRLATLVLGVVHFAATLCLAPHFMSQASGSRQLDIWGRIEFVLLMPVGLFGVSSGCLFAIVGLVCNSLLWGAVLASLYVLVRAGASYVSHYLTTRRS